MEYSYEDQIRPWFEFKHILEDKYEVVESDEACDPNKVRIEEFSTVHNLNEILY